jgi:F0F1-type ATP synthase membrane subunit b/b'
LKSEGQDKEKEILEKAQLEASEKLESAKKSLAGELAQAKGDLEVQAKTLGAQIASKLLGRELTLN